MVIVWDLFVIAHKFWWVDYLLVGVFCFFGA